jgi:ribonucleoside-diphosphate reductase alpha chain
VTVDEHLTVLICANRWCDSSVSKTCNVTGKMPWEDFKRIYMECWENGVKGCTVYNVDGKRNAILKSCNLTGECE